MQGNRSLRRRSALHKNYSGTARFRKSTLSWVDKYRTGSGSDWVELAINKLSRIAEDVASNDDELRTSQTPSLPLPVLYSSTHNAIDSQNQNSIEGSDFGLSSRGYDFLCKAAPVSSFQTNIAIGESTESGNKSGAAGGIRRWL